VTEIALTFASFDYDHTRALTDGRVKVASAEIRHVELHPVATFQRMLEKREFEIAEMALTCYLISLDRGASPFVALPVFPVRAFRHGAIFVRVGGPVNEPRDLIGKRVGEFLAYGGDAGTWAKGILADEYGVPHDSYSYAIGGIGMKSGPLSWMPNLAPPNIRVEHIGAQRTLDEMLEMGELDAVIGPHAPPSMMRREGKVRRLFENYEEVERGWFRKTRIFPIMHTLVMRRDVYEANRGLARALYDAFKEAKDIALQRYRDVGHIRFGIPWMTPHLDTVAELMGPDWWPYGAEANRPTLEAFARYHHQHGLSRRRIPIEEMFAPETLAV